MFLSRDTICGLLRISKPASYRYAALRPRRLGLISSADVADMLNRNASAGQRRVGEIVPETLTADEVSAETGVPARRIILATRRLRDPLPHWRLNSHVVRFDLQTAVEWIGRAR